MPSDKCLHIPIVVANTELSPSDCPTSELAVFIVRPYLRIEDTYKQSSLLTWLSTSHSSSKVHDEVPPIADDDDNVDEFCIAAAIVGSSEDAIFDSCCAEESLGSPLLPMPPLLALVVPNTSNLHISHRIFETL